MTRVTGHVFMPPDPKRPGRKRAVWYVKYRVPDANAKGGMRQVQKLLGPAWTERSRPPAGYFTRKMAEDALGTLLAQAREGTLPGSRPTGRTFAEACAEYLRYVEVEKGAKPSTLIGYRSVNRTLIDEFGDDGALDAITTQRIEDYRAELFSDGELTPRTIQKRLTQLHGILKRVKRLKWIATNPAEDVERVRVRRSGDFNVLTPTQLEAVARSAASEQDAALFRVAGYTGLRLGELRALRWVDVDFISANVFVRLNYTQGGLGTPKSDRVRSVPLIDEAAASLDGLSRREHFTEPEDLVFCSEVGKPRDEADVRDGFYAALKASGLGHLRTKTDPIVFHDLRHTFGTLAVQAWPLTDVQAYMGHADVQTTMIYVHHVPKARAAAELGAVVRKALGDVSRTVSRTAENGEQLSATEPALEAAGAPSATA